MATKNYGQLERTIIDNFKAKGNFYFQGKNYKLVTVGKPSVSNGECKTDVYILGKTESGEQKEIKISVKTESSNEFQENKVSALRAEEYFGLDWASIIAETCRKIEDRFISQSVVFGSGKHPTKPNSITLGWKLEIASKERKLSAPIALSDQQIREYVYKGSNLSDSKKNAFVNGSIIPNSGVAEYILYSELYRDQNPDAILQNLKLIDSLKIKPTYLIFTANNWRTDVDSTDGPRPLAVRVKWEVINGKLSRSLLFDNPLSYTGQDWRMHIKPVLKQLGVQHPSQMTYSHFNEPKLFIP
ncbi:hypothetical protein PVOR_01620 [Paenibacillus vortex V453]|uniref:Uncharacterized protein n=1 Tax=Paenibacillus vortex V453 TaxID=715225 RepID=A0A2R9T2A7_9BACL|nr:hypothetical protein [Paenibacillus vortex]EFU43869.1 hypothetical protein PVOR_01620 [Paenibacillus vortex V453]